MNKDLIEKLAEEFNHIGVGEYYEGGYSDAAEQILEAIEDAGYSVVPKVDPDDDLLPKSLRDAANLASNLSIRLGEDNE